MKYLSTETNLNTHMVLTHTEEDKKNLKCSICDKKFLRHGDLNNHRRSHVKGNRENPFKCSLCHKSFVHNDTLEKHVLVHGKQFHCKFCKFNSNRKDNVKTHEKIHLSQRIPKKYLDFQVFYCRISRHEEQN